MTPVSIRPGANVWDAALLALLARWQGGDAKTTGLDAAGKAVLEKLGRTPEARREATLATLRRALGNLPLDEIHPSWLAEALPADPLLRLWGLESLPQPVRGRVAELLPSPNEASGAAWRFLPPAPDWFRAFFERELDRRFPLALPRPGGATNASALAELASLPEPRLLEALTIAGLLPLAAALGELGTREALRVAFALPPRLRELMRQRSKGEKDPRGPAWAARFTALSEAGEALAAIPRTLGLEEVAAVAAAHQASASQTGDELRRLALRLPRPLGAPLLARFAAPEPSLAPADARKGLLQLRSALVEAVTDPTFDDAHEGAPS